LRVWDFGFYGFWEQKRGKKIYMGYLVSFWVKKRVFWAFFGNFRGEGEKWGKKDVFLRIYPKKSMISKMGIKSIFRGVWEG